MRTPTEIFSLKLNLMNVFVVASLGAILLFDPHYIYHCIYTSGEFIPGYSSSKLKKMPLN
jgi:hypothetical protein